MAGHRSKLVFSDGAEVLLSDDAAAVRQRLIDTHDRRQPFTELTKANGNTVYVAPKQVAYVEDLG